MKNCQIKYYTWKKIIILALQYRDLTTTLLLNTVMHTHHYCGNTKNIHTCTPIIIDIFKKWRQT